MHTFSETGAGVPAFLAKLWRLVDDPDTNNLICWSKDGRSFIIQNQAQFARELLPLNYKHNNMASFIRQLNMYGFHKITSIDNGGLKFDRDEMEFSHPCFKRNCSYLLEHIKRKIANTKGLDEKSALKPEAVTKVLQDVKAMRGRQDSLDSRFSVMKQENEALWREIASLRQKHAKQQQIVNKLIQFLITIVQPTRNMTSVKRQMQLMINDKPENGKFRKTSESESECGPVIHELGEELLDEVTEDDVELIDPNSPYNQMAAAHARDNESPSPLNIERPTSSISQVSQHYDYSNQSIEDVLNSAANVVTPSTPAADGNANVAGGGCRAAFANAAAAMSASSSSIIQSVNPDGSRIVYHVTEVPDGNDAQARETGGTMPLNYNEDNVLTTPLVRQQMERSHQLKQKNKQRRRQADMETNRQQRLPTTCASQQQQQQKSLAGQNIQIKAEKEIDPMSFLNVFSDENVLTTDAQLLSPNLSEDSRQSGINVTAGGGGVALMENNANTNSNRSAATTPTTDALISGTSSDFYNPDNFITGDMPADIFDDSSLLSADNNNYNNDFKLNQQQQYGRSTTTGGKFSTFIAGNNNNNNNSNANGASTSAAAAAAAATSTISSGSNGATSKRSGGGAAITSTSTSQGKNGNNMAVTKYHDEGLRLSTPDEVIGHLDNVQDELESLKDLLRGDGYSLDANALIGVGNSTTQNKNTNNKFLRKPTVPMDYFDKNGTSTQNSNNRLYLTPTGVDGDFLNKLFNDSEMLGPYGLSLSNESSNDKKGSELMTYQPFYDLSDIIDINDKNELDADSNTTTSTAPSGSRQIPQQQQGSSALNTPYHE